MNNRQQNERLVKAIMDKNNVKAYDILKKVLMEKTKRRINDVLGE